MSDEFDPNVERDYSLRANLRPRSLDLILMGVLN